MNHHLQTNRTRNAIARLTRTLGLLVALGTTSLGIGGYAQANPDAPRAKTDEAVRIEVARPSNGHVAVSVDGRSVGAAPVAVAVGAGSHTVTLRWASGSVTEERMTTVAGDHILLRPAPPRTATFAMLRLSSSPNRTASAVYIDGQNYGPAPVVQRVTPGEHRIDVHWADGSASSRTWFFKAGDDVNLSGRI